MANHVESYQSGGLNSVGGVLFVSGHCHLRISIETYSRFKCVNNLKEYMESILWIYGYLLLTIEGVKESLSKLSDYMSLEITAKNSN